MKTTRRREQSHQDSIFRKDFTLTRKYPRVFGTIITGASLMLNACGAAGLKTAQYPSETSEPETSTPGSPKTPETSDSKGGTPNSGQNQENKPVTSPTPQASPTASSTPVPTPASPADPAPSSTPDTTMGQAKPMSPETIGSGTCSAALPSKFEKGFSDHCLQIGNLSRIYRVYMPTGIQSASQLKSLVFVLHGGGGSAKKASELNGNALAVFQQVAEREKFLLIYPEGTEDNAGKNGWNDCRSDDLEKSAADDVTFLENLVSKMQINFQLPPAKTFMAGTSNGAMMTYRFVMEKSELLGGASASSGNIAANPISGRCTEGPKRAIPMLLTHGTKDPIVPTKGGPVACLKPGDGTQCTRGTVKSTLETVNFWLNTLNLKETKPVLETRDINFEDSGKADKRSYFPATGGTDGTTNRAHLVSWMLIDAGHSVPSLSIDSGELLIGAQNRDIEFAEESWTFFQSQLQSK